MPTTFENSKTTALDASGSAAIKSARAEQRMTLREFGSALGVSHNMVALWESGDSLPDRHRIAAWISDERPWVQAMGLRLFASQYGALIRNVLVPA